MRLHVAWLCQAMQDLDQANLLDFWPQLAEALIRRDLRPPEATREAFTLTDAQWEVIEQIVTPGASWSLHRRDARVRPLPLRTDPRRDDARSGPHRRSGGWQSLRSGALVGQREVGAGRPAGLRARPALPPPDSRSSGGTCQDQRHGWASAARPASVDQPHPGTVQERRDDRADPARQPGTAPGAATKSAAGVSLAGHSSSPGCLTRCGTRPRSRLPSRR